MIRPTVRRRGPRRGLHLSGLLGGGAAILVAGMLLVACHQQDGDDEGLPGISKGITAGFVADQSPACARADLVSLQRGATSGSLLGMDLVLTDCDASLAVTGIAFEIAFDAGVADLVGCAPGPLFPTGQLAPGTPECVETGSGVLGTISLVSPGSVRVGGAGYAAAVRLTFNVTRKGISSPITFLGPDAISSTAVFYIDPTTHSATSYQLGLAGYAGGTLISN